LNKKIKSIFTYITIKRQRIRLRQIMSGYRLLKQSGRLNLIETVKQDLTTYKLSPKNSGFSSLIMGSDAGIGEKVVRQYLLHRLVAGLNFNAALLFALGKDEERVVYPLPKEWREILMKHDFKVDHFRSELYWQLYVFYLLLMGIYRIISISFAGFFFRNKNDLYKKCDVYFAHLSLDIVSRKNKSGKSFDIISWYLQWNGRIPNIEVIRHDVTKALPERIGNI